MLFFLSQAEKAFAAEYLVEHGRPWSAFWPKPPPTLYMWPSAFVGQVHAVATPFGPFDCPLDRFWHKDWVDAYSEGALAALSAALETTAGGGGAGAQDGGQAALDACHAAVASVRRGAGPEHRPKQREKAKQKAFVHWHVATRIGAGDRTSHFITRKAGELHAPGRRHSLVALRHTVFLHQQATGGAMQRASSGPAANVTYQLEAVSASPGPKIFTIQDLVSAEEADHIVRVRGRGTEVCEECVESRQWAARARNLNPALRDL